MVDRLRPEQDVVVIQFLKVHGALKGVGKKANGLFVEQVGKVILNVSRFFLIIGDEKMALWGGQVRSRQDKGSLCACHAGKFKPGGRFRSNGLHNALSALFLAVQLQEPFKIAIHECKGNTCSEISCHLVPTAPARLADVEDKGVLRHDTLSDFNVRIIQPEVPQLGWISLPCLIIQDLENGKCYSACRPGRSAFPGPGLMVIHPMSRTRNTHEKFSPHFPRKKLSPFPAFRFLYHQIKDKHYTRNRHFSVKQISVLQHAANQPFCWCNGNPLLVIPSVMQEMMPM